MKRFDYKVLTISAAHLRKRKFQAELDEKFQQWGNEGWELIKMEPILSNDIFFAWPRTRELLAIFKREKI